MNLDWNRGLAADSLAVGSTTGWPISLTCTSFNFFFAGINVTAVITGESGWGLDTAAVPDKFLAESKITDCGLSVSISVTVSFLAVGDGGTGFACCFGIERSVSLAGADSFNTGDAVVFTGGRSLIIEVFGSISLVVNSRAVMATAIKPAAATQYRRGNLRRGRL